ncbi:MAG: AtpZ/AtpI family protein [Candidatus Neomarinimicrobiota bacterium]
MSAASTMTGAVVGLGLLGFLLDRKFESAPYLLLAGLLVGLVVGFYDIWKVMFRPGRKS